ncbi:MAG: RNA polymerase sigma factor RpoD/SigA [Chryseolinea sp.]
MRNFKVTFQITNRESQSLDRYLQEVRRVDLISAEEEVELAIRIKEGDQVALEKLVNANLRFVVSVAKQYQHGSLPLNDLINEGNVGLVKAAQRFDATRGFKFISYAVWWIRQAIMQALAEQSRVIRIPLNRVGELNKINRTFAALEQQFQREPTVEEIANAIELTPDEIRDVVKIGSRQISINAPIIIGEESTLGDLLRSETDDSPDSSLNAGSLQRDVQRSLSTLSQRESDVLSLYFGLNGRTAPLTLDEIGDFFSLTRERVRQIKENALRRLRHTSRSKVLIGYLG